MLIHTKLYIWNGVIRPKLTIKIVFLMGSYNLLKELNFVKILNFL